MDIAYWLIYLGVGIFVGFFAGLLGIGGGSVMVPILSLTFASQGFSNDHVVHMALATSMATIIPGGITSAWTHHKHKAVNWLVVKQMKPTKKVFRNVVLEKCAMTAPDNVPTKIPGNICLTTSQFTAWCL